MKRSAISCLLVVAFLIFSFFIYCSSSYAADVTEKIVDNSSYQLPETFEDLCQTKAPCSVKFNDGSIEFSEIAKGERGGAVVEKIVFHDFDKDGKKDAVISIIFNPPTYSEEDVYYILSSNAKQTHFVKMFGDIKAMSVNNGTLVIKASGGFMDPDVKTYTYSFKDGQFSAD